MKNILRNFWVIITRFKMASILNIVGLAIAFTVFMIIMMQSYWEFSFNKSIPDNERIYRFENKYMNQEGSFSVNSSRPMGEAIAKSSSKIESYCLYNNWGSQSLGVLGSDNQMQNFTARINIATPSIVDVFGFKILEGKASEFENNTSVALIDSKTAKDLFGTKSAVGQYLYGQYDTATIVAVYEAFPENCVIKNGVVYNIGTDALDKADEWSYIYYYKLVKGVDQKDIYSDVMRSLKECFGDDTKEDYDSGLQRMLPVNRIYFEGQEGGGGNLTLSMLLIAIAFLIIGIAIINFVNFFMALVPVRIRSVNINKIFGTPVAALRANVIGEALGTVILAFFLSLVVVQSIKGSYIEEFVDCSIALSDNIFVVVATGVIAIIMGLLAGVYPAYYITKFPPMVVINGSFGRSKAGQRLRSVLVGVQFVISIALIIGASFVILQTKYMQDADMGYNRYRLVTVNVGEIAEKPAAFLSELKKTPDIVDVAYSRFNITNIRMGWGRVFNGESIYLVSLPGSWNFPQFMGFKLLEGRFFIQEDASKESGTMIINQTAAKRYKMKVGDFCEGHAGPAEIVGIIADFNFQSKKVVVEPMVVYEFGTNGWGTPNVANIRLTPTADYKTAIESIKKAMKTINPSLTDDEISIKPFDELVESLYQREQMLISIIVLFSIVAIFISLVGVFGLVVFEVQYRRKEIALRKVHGATSASIPVMINKKFIKVIAISAIIAIPSIYYCMWVWLQNFAYQVPLYWWVGLVAVGLVVLITFLVVTFQTYKTATDNPINALKKE